MDIVDISQKIIDLSEELGRAKKSIKDRVTEKAETKARYDQVLALTIIRLKNEDITEFEGVKFEKIAVSNIETVAKGICWNEKLAFEKAEGLYKSAITYIEATTTQLQGYQSIFRHLDNV